MTNPLPDDFVATVSEIDAEVTRLLKINGDEALLPGLHLLMLKVKPILDAAEPGQMDALCERFVGFRHFMQLLESISQAIADGRLGDILQK